jgi:hypothetical protein
MRRPHLHGLWYILLAHPEDEAWLTSNLSAALGKQADGRAETLSLAATWLHSTLLTFTLGIPSEVPSTQLISDLSNPYPAGDFH